MNDYFFWIAVILNLVAIVLVYYLIFQMAKSIYKKGTVWLIAFLIFMSPFAYALTKADNLLSLLWVILLTPFYAVALSMILSTTWTLLYYSVAYGALALLYLLFVKGKIARRLLDRKKHEEEPASNGKIGEENGVS